MDKTNSTLLLLLFAGHFIYKFNCIMGERCAHSALTAKYHVHFLIVICAYNTHQQYSLVPKLVVSRWKFLHYVRKYNSIKFMKKKPIEQCNSRDAWPIQLILATINTTIRLLIKLLSRVRVMAVLQWTALFSLLVICGMFYVIQKPKLCGIKCIQQHTKDQMSWFLHRAAQRKSLRGEISGP